MRFGRARLWDVAQALWWLMENKAKNNFDPKVIDYPTITLFKAEDEGKALAYLPAHRGVILESLAYNPDVTDPEMRLKATLGLLKEACQAAQADGAREAYYMSSDPKFDEHAIKHAGFEKVQMLRVRL